MRTRKFRIVIAGALSLALGGCAGTAKSGSWGSGAHWPDGAELTQAAVRAAKSPLTWVPLVGAAGLAIGDADDSVSDWASDETPLFGSDASDASDTLRDITTASYSATALIAPSDSLADKAKGLAVGGATIGITSGVTKGLKSITDRERPNEDDNRSFPSSHASGASSRATMTVANLDYLPMPTWARTGLTVGLYSTAAGAAWARVEAEEHHVTDVLVGFSLGHFIAVFMQEAFLETGAQDLSISFTPVPEGGVMNLRFPLGPD